MEDDVEAAELALPVAVEFPPAAAAADDDDAGVDRTTLALSVCDVSVLLVQARTRILFCVDSVQVKLTVSAVAEAVHTVAVPDPDPETEFQTVCGCEMVFAEPAVADEAATTMDTGPLVAPTAAPPVPVPAFTSAAVGAVAPFANTAHRTFSVFLLVNEMSRMVPPRSGAADAGCDEKPAVN